MGSNPATPTNYNNGLTEVVSTWWPVSNPATPTNYNNGLTEVVSTWWPVSNPATPTNYNNGLTEVVSTWWPVSNPATPTNYNNGLTEVVSTWWPVSNPATPIFSLTTSVSRWQKRRMKALANCSLIFLLLASACAAHVSQPALSDGGTPLHQNDKISLAWDPSVSTAEPPPPPVTGYKIYYGTSSGTYTWVQDAGSATTTTISGLDPNQIYYFCATAYAANGQESLRSTEATGSPAHAAKSFLIIH